MKINWKVRFKNKTFVLALSAAVVAFVYEILGLCGVVPQVGQDSVTQLIVLIVNLLVTVGILVDPTTKGLCDSEQAMKY